MSLSSSLCHHAVALHYLCLSHYLFFLFLAEADPAFSGGSVSMKMLAPVGSVVPQSLFNPRLNGLVV
jgi:hypothetical protein